MKPIRLILAVVMLLVPLAARTLWYYQGTYQPSQPVVIPDYMSFTAPKPSVSTPLPAPAATKDGKPVVLFDLSHDNYYFISEIAPLTHVIEQLGGRVEIVASSKTLEDQLKYASSLAIIVPTSQFSTIEISTIQRFVTRGGHLLVITDPMFNIGGGASSTPPVTSVEAANFLLESYGISFADDYVYNLVSNEGNFRHVILTRFAKNPLTQNLSKVVFYSAHSLITSQTTLITGDVDSLSSLSDSGGGLILAASAQQDKVLAIGNKTFLTSPYSQVADNQQLILNIARFLISQPNSLALTEFPHLFSRPVSLLVPSTAAIDQNLLAALSIAQSGFQQMDLSATLATKPVDGSDLVIFSTMPVSIEFQSYTDPYKLVFTREIPPTATPAALPTYSLGLSTPEASGGGGPSGALNWYVTVPGFGKFDTNGLGLVLFSPGKDRNTLIFLAGAPGDLTNLAGLFAAGSLQDCVIQGQVAVCKLSGGGK